MPPCTPSERRMTFVKKIILGALFLCLLLSACGKEEQTQLNSSVVTTNAPTMKPMTTVPTTVTTNAPTTKPTTTVPTTVTTNAPTTKPSTVPTTLSTTKPTTVLTTKPATAPTTKPSTVPTTLSTLSTTKPTTVLTTKPATAPTTKPSSVPTTLSTLSTTKSTTVLTTRPATAPTTKPSTVPTTLSTLSTTKPTTVLTTKPATAPTTKPSTVPTTLSTTKPTTVPTSNTTKATTNTPHRPPASFTIRDNGKILLMRKAVTDDAALQQFLKEDSSVVMKDREDVTAFLKLLDSLPNLMIKDAVSFVITYFPEKEYIDMWYFMGEDQANSRRYCFTYVLDEDRAQEKRQSILQENAECVEKGQFINGDRTMSVLTKMPNKADTELDKRIVVYWLDVDGWVVSVTYNHNQEITSALTLEQVFAPMYVEETFQWK